MIITQGKGLLPKTVITLLLVTSLFVSCRQNGDEKLSANTTSVFQWKHATPESQGMSSQKLDEMRSILAEKGTKKLLIIKNDKIVYKWFASGWEDSLQKHYTASLAKAIVGGMSLLAAMDDGYITLDEPACNYIPTWKADNRKSKITIRQLATHSSGISDAEATSEEREKMKSKGLHPHFDLPGWKGQFWRQEPDPFSISRDSAPVIFTPGEKHAYSNPGITMLTYAVTSSLKDSKYSDIRTYLKERIYEPIGIDENEYSIGYGKTFEIDGMGLVPSPGGGNFTAQSLARIGLLMLHKGNWQGKKIIDSSTIENATRPWRISTPPSGTSDMVYTSVWYNNNKGFWRYVPRDAYCGSGAQKQILMVIPSLQMVIVRMGAEMQSEDESYWESYEKYLFNPIMDAVEEHPYPKSNISVKFAPKDSVIRMAEGSDSWPSTWADDDNQYMAYGDGWGFSPKADIKLSLGFAKVIGDPPSIEGINIRSKTGERVGDGKFGSPVSGMLMVDGILYMLSRNVENALLSWSSDHGKTWEQANWKFDVSFGYPGFLNYGKNYEGAKDDYVYIYSHDEASAYKISDHFVLARVPKDKIKDWREYEYFAGYKAGNKPKWSEDIRKREPVFTNPGKCYRSRMTFNRGLKRYLWVQTITSSPPPEDFRKGDPDGRFYGGIGIFESPNPWGPWETVYYKKNWDIGPGESSSIPTKWMSDDGKTGYLLFSGDDYFSLRKLNFVKD